MITWAFRVLAAHDKQQTAARLDKVNPLSWLYKQAAVARERLGQVQHEMGRVVAMAWYQAKAPDIDDQLDECFISCAMCSL